ncbi:hypothetical protein AB0B21_13225 [Streptomyces rimosus]|uniref:hypothetical protein n=1 Tax=Streptomyces rimosus TaxID=1927 RepID=UPI001F45E59D|nr:hypothetical protein [Streptomyces rimosus]
MLDYAANAARCWPAALLQSAFQETCAGDGRLLEEAYGKLLGDRSPEEFWMTVEERLAAGQMRLLFVADRIPLELRAIVEFLNRQLRQTDVYAVELTQYRGDGDHCVLAPRIHGEVATAAKSSSGRRAARKTTHAEMDSVLRTRLTPELRLIVEALLDHATARGRLEGGTALYPSMSVHYPVAGRQVPIWTLSLYDNPAKEELAFSFGPITHHLGLDRAAKFAESLPDLPALQEKLTAQREKGYKGWLSVPLAVLADEPGAAERVLAAIQELMETRDA